MEHMTKNHSKFLLQYHFIFVVKYRKKIIGKFPVKAIFTKISEDQNFVIEMIEVDKDHIHFLQELKKDFWRGRTFWSGGYFVSTIGNVSEETLSRYIGEQG